MSGNVSAAVGLRVSARRAELRLSQQDLAGRLGITNSAMSRIESGHRGISVDRLVDLALALNTTPGALLDAEEEGLR